MKRQQWWHLAGLVAVVLVAVLIAGATGAVELAAGFVVFAAAVLHLGVLASLIAWIVARVRRDRASNAPTADVEN